MASSWPLESQHLDMLNSVLDTESVLRPFLQKCKDCGYPVDNEIATAEAQWERARKVKGAFFPDES